MNTEPAPSVPELPMVELLDLRVPDLPPRSRLYHLEPIGVGSAFTESLTGYCARLAEVHHLRVGTFLGKIINPLMAQPLSVGDARKRRHGWETAHLHLMNGTGTLAADFCSALQRLTLRPDLRPLTLLHWDELFPSTKGLLRQHRAWCPACLAERRSTGLPVYEHLAWSLAPVGICLQHGSPLREHCPRCGITMKPLTNATVPGHCSHCEGWLGTEAQPPSGKEPLDGGWVRWSADALADLIATPPTLPRPPSYRAAFFGAVRFWSARAGICSAGALAEAAQCHKTTAREWLVGTNLPEVGQLLRLLNVCDLSVNEFLNRQRTVLSEHNTIGALPQRSQAKKWMRRSFDVEAVKANLQAVLDDPVAPPPTVTEFCRRNQYVRSVVYEYLPQLCMALAAKSAEHRAEVGRFQLGLKLRTVRRAVDSVHAEGLPLTQTNLCSRLPKPGILRDPKIKSAMRSAVADLKS